jgi:hypothetical protein
VAVNVVLSVDGKRVVELETCTEDAVAAARVAGAELVWTHSEDDLSALGFHRAGAYTHLRAEAVPVRDRGEPPFLEERDYAEVLARAYSGLWGHKHVPHLAQPPEDAVVVGVPVTGLCRVWPAQRLIDAPGILPEARSPDAYASLLLYACAVLGPGPADLESWGDSDEVLEAYEDLGFDVVKQSAGWERALA